MKRKSLRAILPIGRKREENIEVEIGRNGPHRKGKKRGKKKRRESSDYNRFSALEGFFFEILG